MEDSPAGRGKRQRALVSYDESAPDDLMEDDLQLNEPSLVEGKRQRRARANDNYYLTQNWDDSDFVEQKQPKKGRPTPGLSLYEVCCHTLCQYLQDLSSVLIKTQFACGQNDQCASLASLPGILPNASKQPHRHRLRRAEPSRPSSSTWRLPGRWASCQGLQRRRRLSCRKAAMSASMLR